MSFFDIDAPPPVAGPIEGLDCSGDPHGGDQDVLDVFETPAADEFGRLRVHDQDTGHALTISALAFAHGNFTVLDEPASDATGSPLPPEHNRFPVEPTPTSGQEAENQEKDNA